MDAKTRGVRRSLLAARRYGYWVRLKRTYDDDPVRGVLLAVEGELFLMLRGDSEGYLGFEVSHLDELKSVAKEPYERFYRRALKLRGVRRPRTPLPPLDSIESLLRWLEPRFDVVTVFWPQTHPDTCRIGKLIEVGPRAIEMQGINPDGSWDRWTSRLRVAHIRRVEWGSDPYVESLLLVGGPPPPLDPELED